MTPKHTFKIDPYADACCGDCASYGAEVDDECEVFNNAIAFMPQGFGTMTIPATTSKCREFKPSQSYLADLGEATAFRREQAVRQQAVWMGEHA